MAASALAVAANDRPNEYLDQETGATVAVVREPLVFVRERPAFGRDYVTLAATAVDQSGHLTYMLVGYIWSVGSSAVPDTRPAAAGVILQADEKRIELALANRSTRELGIGVPVHRPPLGSPTPYVYLVDLATVRLLAESHRLSLHVHEDSGSLSYQLFEDGRSALREFVRSARAE